MLYQYVYDMFLYMLKIVVGTPGRMLALMNTSRQLSVNICFDIIHSYLQCSEETSQHLSQCERIKFLVLDEADRLLEHGHFHDLELIFQYLKTSIPRTRNQGELR